jgi:hypothetical protein
MPELSRVEEPQGQIERRGSGIMHLDSFRGRAEGLRQKAARVFSIQPGGNQRALKPHVDPYRRAMDTIDEGIEDEIA